MNDCFDRLIKRYHNRTGIFQMDYSITYKLAFLSGLKLLFNFYVKRTVNRQDFAAKFNFTNQNGASVADILDVEINDLKVNITSKIQYKQNGEDIGIKFKHCIA